VIDSPQRWREPSSLIPLRWGSWAGRSWGGLALIIGGGAAIAGSSAATGFTLLLAAVGVGAHVVGWGVLPAKGWRRVVVIAPSTLTMVSLLPGPSYLTLLVVPFLAWLLVRQRPLRVAPMAAFVIATGVVLGRVFPGYEGMLTASCVALFVMVGAAWAARAVHAATARPRRTSRRVRSNIS
jgi:hypothetical protein